MASSFGRYTGGIQPIQGINEFGAQQAAGIERTMTGLANTITKTYDTLNQQEEELNLNKGMAAGSADNLKKIRDLLAANPDNKGLPLVAGMDEMIARLGMAGNMSRGELKALVKSAEAYTSNLPLTMQLQDKAFLAQTTARVNEALARAAKERVYDKVNKPIDVPSFQAGSPERYKEMLREVFTNHNKDNPDGAVDVEKYVRDSFQMQLQKFTKDDALKKTDPLFHQGIIRGFESVIKRDELGNKLESQTSEDYGTGENIMEQIDALAKADSQANVSPFEARRAEIKAETDKLAEEALAAQRKTGDVGLDKFKDRASVAISTLDIAKKNSAVAELDLIKLKRQQLINGATADELKGDIGGKDYSILGNFFTGGATGTKAIQDRTKELSKGWTSLSNAVNEFGIVGSIGKGQSLGDLTKEEFEILPKTQRSALIQEVANAKNNAKIITTAAAKMLEDEGDAGLPKALKSFDDAIKAKEAQINATKPKVVAPVETTAEGVTPVKTVPAKPEERKPDIYDQGFSYNMTIPNVTKAGRPLTYAEELESVKKYYLDNYGGVAPSVVDSIYKTMRPESAMKTVTTESGHTLLWNDKTGTWSELSQIKAGTPMTSKQRSDEDLYNYGRVVGDRRIAVEARANSGIMVKGFFGGGEKRAEAFAKQLDDTASLLESIPQLLAMFDKFGHSILPLNQEEQGTAEGLLVKIKAAVRPETIGGGPIAIPEHAMLEKRVGNPNLFFSWDKTEMAKLRGILESAKSQTQRISGGVDVQFRQPTIAGQNPIQQNRVANAANRGN